MWELKRTKQCAKCPWRKDTNPLDIPNGYSVQKHQDLRTTIAEDSITSQLEKYGEGLNSMSCHERHDAYCVGWLMNQIGDGNNVRLRLKMISCTNAKDIELVGEQHDTFEKTLPS